jgi:hypothetical protein
MRAFFLHSVSAFLRVVLRTFVLLLSFILWHPTVKAQSVPTPPADVQKVVSEIGDLDLLKALVPLRLTASQIEKLQVPLKEIAADNEARRKADYEALRGIATDIKNARDAALKGDTVSKEVENRVLQVFSAADDRFAKSKKQAIDKIFTVVKESWTSDQKDEVERQIGKLLGGKRLIPKEYRNDPKKAPKDAVQDLALQMYIERILIADRVAEILTHLQTPVPENKPERSVNSP